MGVKLVIEVNQQQKRMLEWLIDEGKHGSTPGEVIRSGFVEFCRLHPEIVGEDAPTGQER